MLLWVTPISSLAMNRHFFTFPNEKWFDRQCWETQGTAEQRGITGHLLCVTLPGGCAPSQFNNQVTFIFTFKRGGHVGWRWRQMLEMIQLLCIPFTSLLTVFTVNVIHGCTNVGKPQDPQTESPGFSLEHGQRTQRKWLRRTHTHLNSSLTRAAADTADVGVVSVHCDYH